MNNLFCKLVVFDLIYAYVLGSVLSVMFVCVEILLVLVLMSERQNPITNTHYMKQ